METKNKNFEQTELEELAKKRVKKMKRFYNHLLIYFIGVVVFILNEYCDAPFNFPPLQYLNWVFMCCWTFILAVDGLEFFMTEVMLGKRWESKKIEEILTSESSNQKK